MKSSEHTQLFTEITIQEATQINGGLSTQQLIGAALGGAGSAWWSRNFWGNVGRGNLGGAISVTDRNLRGLTNSLNRFGIAVPRWLF
jgi:hypothetical protein